MKRRVNKTRRCCRGGSHSPSAKAPRGKAESLQREAGGVEDAVGGASDLKHFGHLVDTDNVSAAEDAGGHCGGRGPTAFIGWNGSGFAIAGQRRAEKAFAR